MLVSKIIWLIILIIILWARIIWDIRKTHKQNKKITSWKKWKKALYLTLIVLTHGALLHLILN